MAHLPSSERRIQPMLNGADGPSMSQIIGDERYGLSSSVGLRLTEVLGDFATQFLEGFIPVDAGEQDVLAAHPVIPLRWKRKHFPWSGLPFEDLDHCVTRLYPIEVQTEDLVRTQAINRQHAKDPPPSGIVDRVEGVDYEFVGGEDSGFGGGVVVASGVAL